MFHSRSAWVTAFVVLNGLHVRSAQLQLGPTTLTGRDIPTLGQEFFGGMSFLTVPCAGILNVTCLPRYPVC